MKIGVMDSGIGGLSTLYEIIKLLPNNQYIYYHDGVNNPYGNKSLEELMTIVESNVKELIKRGCQIIVIACNTATTNCISYLRKKYNDIIFVGAEPAIKKAFDNNYKDILMLATPLTVKSKRVNELIKKYQKDKQEITLLACDNLAKLIEIKDYQGIDLVLKNLKERLKEKNDAIVLGCTHYCLIKDQLKRFFPNAVLIDGNKGIAKRVATFVDDESEFAVDFILTNNEVSLKELKKILKEGKIC